MSPRVLPRSSLAIVFALATPALHAQAPTLERVAGASVPSFGWSHEVHRLRSEVLEEELEVFVAKPPSFTQTQAPFPVLYLLDGQFYFAEVAACAAALASTGQIPELVLVGIQSRDRRRDFTPAEIELPDVGDEACAELYLDFLEHELVPAVEGGLCGGRPRILLAHSHAGILALHALARRPTLFPWVLELDAPVHLEHGFLATQLERTLDDPLTPPVRLASFARVFGWSDERWAALLTRARPGDQLTRARLEDESHESLVFAGAYRGLQRLFLDSSTLGARALSAREVEDRYRALAPAYGGEVVPPEPLMRRVVEDFLMEGYGARAEVWLARWTDAYGRPPDHAELTRRAREVAALGEPTETVADLLAMPRATPAQMAAHLGTWIGTSRMGASRLATMSARFWVEEDSAGQDVVRGEVDHEQGPPMTVEYLHVRTDGTLEFGYRNGMRPRGLLVYTESSPGGALEGEMLWRGIRFTPPAGHEMPAVRFELTRAPEAAK